MKTKKQQLAMFKISIHDGFCEYQYPLMISGSESIASIAKKIAEALKCETRLGKGTPRK